MSKNSDSLPTSEGKKLPPGQKEVKKLPALSKGSVPDWPADWKLHVFGCVKEEKKFSLPQLQEMQEVLKQTQDFHCVEGWSKSDIEWTGIRFKDLVTRIEINEEVEHVLFYALDGYKTNLPLEICMNDDVLISWELEGEQIPLKHGGKVRTVIESKYAYKSVKWLSEIEFKEKEEKGYWEKRGYSNSADPWKEKRFAD